MDKPIVVDLHQGILYNSMMVEFMVTNERDFANAGKKIPGERDKTPEERILLKDLFKFIPQFIRQYGGKRLPLTQRMVHFIADSDVLPDEYKPDSKGFFSGRCLENGTDVIVYATSRQDEQPDILELALIVSHELIHLHAFHSFSKKGDSLGLRRGGFNFYNNKKEGWEIGFYGLDEGVTQQLTEFFDYAYFDRIPLLKDRLSEREVERKKSDDYDDRVAYPRAGKWFHYPYAFERCDLQNVITKLQEKYCPGRSEMGFYIFERFARSYFTGKIIPLVRYIEVAFGRNSFRELPRIAF